MPTSIFISAGEASGEHYGALLVEELKRLTAARSGEPLKFFGMGGERMRSAGLETIVPAEEMAVMGFSEVVRHLPHIWGEFQKLKRALGERRPAVAVLIDFPDFHLRLARQIRKMGIPVVYFVSPQLWAWKKDRIKLVQRDVSRMMCIFPFEEAFYREHGVEAEFVGHPLAELPPPAISRQNFAAWSRLDPARPWIALLPGSRAKEIRANLPEILEAAWRLITRHGTDAFEFVLPIAPTLNGAQRAMLLNMVERYGGGLHIRLAQDARAALRLARASIVASGTATVEAALAGNPFVVVYRVSRITYAIAKRVVTVPHVAMVNLIAEKRLVPELIQDDFRADRIVQHLEPLLDDGPQRQAMMHELAGLRARMNPFHGSPTHPGAIGRVARAVLEEAGLEAAG